jgi:hypothetical protein
MHKNICKPFTREEVSREKIKLPNVYVLIEPLHVPKDKFFISVESNMKNLMEALDIKNDDEINEEEKATDEKINIRDDAVKRELTDILKTKIIQ